MSNNGERSASTDASGLPGGWAAAVLLLAIAPCWFAAAAWAGMPAPLPTTTGFVLLCVLGISAESDLRRFVILNQVTLPAVAFGALTNAMCAVSPPEVRHALGAVGFTGWLFGSALAFFAFVLMYELKACGGGDVKLATAIGGLLGPWAGVNALLWSLLAAGVFTLALRYGRLAVSMYRQPGTVPLAAPQLDRSTSADAPAPRTAIPLGPFLALGTLVSIFVDGVSNAAQW